MNKSLFIYLGFYIGFNTVQVISQRLVCRKGRGNRYTQLVKVLYCKLPANGKQLPAFPFGRAMNRVPSEVGGESVSTLQPWPHEKKV